MVINCQPFNQENKKPQKSFGASYFYSSLNFSIGLKRVVLTKIRNIKTLNRKVNNKTGPRNVNTERSTLNS